MDSDECTSQVRNELEKYVERLTRIACGDEDKE